MRENYAPDSEYNNKRKEMSFRNAFGIYHVLKQHLEQANRPLTCVDLYDHEDVRALAEDANRVSDYLGHMYRRGLLARHPAQKGGSSMARYAYSWKNPKAAAPAQRHAQPRLSLVERSKDAKPSIAIEETNEGVVIDLQDFTITIRRK